MVEEDDQNDGGIGTGWRFHACSYKAAAGDRQSHSRNEAKPQQKRGKDTVETRQSRNRNEIVA